MMASSPCVRSLLRSARCALLLALFGVGLWAAPSVHAYLDNAPPGTGTFEQRASAEKTTRSRYRKLELASAVLIVICGGAAILWAVRRK